MARQGWAGLVRTDEARHHQEGSVRRHVGQAMTRGRVPLFLPIKSRSSDGLGVILGRIPHSLPIKSGTNDVLDHGGWFLELLRAEKARSQAFECAGVCALGEHVGHVVSRRNFVDGYHSPCAALADIVVIQAEMFDAD